VIECYGTYVLVWNCSEYLFDNACVVTARMEHFNAVCVAAKCLAASVSVDLSSSPGRTSFEAA
jgi:hypothetical protein